MIQKIIRQALVSLFIFAAVLFAFSRVDWMNVFGLHHTIIEEKLGEMYWDLFSRSETFVEDEELTAPLDTLLTVLCRANDIERSHVKLHLVQSDEVNAYACPGDHLVIYTSLVGACKNEEELCGVIAHELAHIECGHVMQKLAKEFGLAALTGMLSGSGGTEALAEVIRVLSSTAYDRTLESEADRLAVTYLLRADINPCLFGDFLFRLSEEEDLPSLAEWISTHPESEKRSIMIRQMAEDEGKGRSFRSFMQSDEWEAYRQKVKEVASACNFISR